MSTRTTRRAEDLQVAGETERLERLVQNMRNLQTGCTVHTGNDTNFSFLLASAQYITLKSLTLSIFFRQALEVISRIE